MNPVLCLEFFSKATQRFTGWCQYLPSSLEPASQFLPSCCNLGQLCPHFFYPSRGLGFALRCPLSLFRLALRLALCRLSVIERDDPLSQVLTVEVAHLKLSAVPARVIEPALKLFSAFGFHHSHHIGGHVAIDSLVYPSQNFDAFARPFCDLGRAAAVAQEG